jgi:hypothetical protein
MDRSPDRLNLEHLKKQAKELNRLCRNGDAQAIAGLRYALRAAAIPRTRRSAAESRSRSVDHNAGRRECLPAGCDLDLAK